jgi:Tol biopolymer transport system component
MRHRSLRRWYAVTAVAVVVAAGAAVAYGALLSPQPVVVRPGNQALPAAAPGGAYIAYAQSRPRHPHLYDTYVKPAGQPRWKVNTRGVSWPGAIDSSDGTTLIYQQARRGNSDLRLIDMSTKVRSIPTGVNTAKWEWQPSISGDWILFGRSWGSRPVKYSIVLHNESTSENRVLEVHKRRPAKVSEPGQVNGDWASWDTYTVRSGASTVRLYQISTSTTTVPRVPRGKAQYASSVLADGTLFFVRADRGVCGRHVQLMERSGGTNTVLAQLPAGYDVFRTAAVSEGGGESTSLYFDRVSCSSGRIHIYKLNVS